MRKKLLNACIMQEKSEERGFGNIIAEEIDEMLQPVSDDIPAGFV
jgi:hypothetical protein